MVLVGKKAWGPSNPLWRWQHRKGKKARKSRRPRTSKPRRTRRTMSRRSKSHRKSFKIPILSLAILGGQAGAAYYESGGDVMEAVNRFQGYYTGLDLTQPRAVVWDPQRLAIGWGPWLVKGLIMRVARPLGAVPKIPFGLPVSVN